MSAQLEPLAAAEGAGSPLGRLARPALAAPLARLDDAALLAHFMARRGVTLFPVADPEAVTVERIDGVLDGVFTFNGETHRLGADVDWLANPSRDVEWHILLHKFYYAVGLGMRYAGTRDARALARWQALTAQWIDCVPPGFIAADVTGRRVQHWVYAWHHFVQSGAAIDAAFHTRFLASLEQQVEYLCANLTPKRNHRTLELLAVFVAGVAFPEFQAAARWRELALSGTLANLEADLLPDGVHCELSTDYHHLAVKNWLLVRRLAAANGIEVPAAMDARLAQALDFAQHVHRPDGIAPSFSDGDARSHLDLLLQGDALYNRPDWRYVASGGAAGRAPAERLASFPDAGYHVIRSGWGETRPFAAEDHLMFDCGPLGEGNHGHLDCLSFELSVRGRPVAVDPGRYTYSEAGDINWRVWFRGTAAHNTVSVDGQQQTRYAPKPVKAGTRHAPGSVRHRILGPAPVATCLHAGSHPQLDIIAGRAAAAEYPAVHTRWILRTGDCWLVVDALHSPLAHDYAQRFQLAPDAAGQLQLHAMAGSLRVDTPSAHWWLAAGGDTAVEQGWVSMTYGEKRPAPVLVTRRLGRTAWFATLIAAPGHAAAGAHAMGLRVLPVHAAGGGDSAEAAAAFAFDTGAGSVNFLFSTQPTALFETDGGRWRGGWLAWHKAAAMAFSAPCSELTLGDAAVPLTWIGR